MGLFGRGSFPGCIEKHDQSKYQGKCLCGGEWDVSLSAIYLKICQSVERFLFCGTKTCYNNDNVHMVRCVAYDSF